MCRHLAYLGPAEPLGGAARRPAARPVPAVLGAAAAAARHGQRRRLRRRLVRRRATRCPPATGGPGRSGPTSPSPTWPGWCAPARCSPPSGPPPWRARTARPRPRRSPPGPGCSATTARSTRLAATRSPRSPPTLPAGRAAVAGGALRLGAALGAGPAPAARRRRARARRWPTPSARSPRRRPAPGSTCCSPTATTIAATAWGDTLWYLRRARPAHGRRLRAVRRRPALAARSPTAPCSPPTRTDVLLDPAQGAPTDREPADPSLTRTLPEDATDAALRADVAARPDPHAQDAAAEVVLRRARQRAVRGDHPAARVLPDPGRAGDPGRPRRPRSPPRPARAPWSSWAPARRRRPGCCSTRCAGRCTRTCPVDVSESALPRRGRGAARRASRAGRARADRRLHRRARRCPARPGRGWSRSSAARSAICCPPSGPRSCASVRALLSPGDALLLGTDLVKDEAVLVAAYDDAAGVTAAFNKNVLTVINRELGADFDPDAFEHVALWDRGAGVDRDAAARPRRADREDPRRWTWPSTSRRARRCAPRCRRSSARRACAPNWPRPGWS